MRVGNIVFTFFRVPNPPSVKSVIKYVDFLNLLKKSMPKSCNIEVLDSAYPLFSKDDLLKLLELSSYKNREYEADLYDCDNYAIGLKALIDDICNSSAFGLVFVDRGDGSKHALNLFLDCDKVFWYVEPQTNNVFLFGGAESIKQGYSPYKVII